MSGTSTDGQPIDVMLRDVVPEDLPVFFEYQADPDAHLMAAFSAIDPTDRTAFDEHWARILEDDELILKTVVYAGETAGYIVSFVRFGMREVGYWIGKPFWGQGVATRALTLFLEQEQTRPLYARTVQDNAGSIRVLEKCGFEIAGEDRGYALARGEDVDEYVLRLDAG